MKTMTMHQSSPFEVGQLAEAKSFKKGYRGAWFRCKIQGTMRRKGKILYALEYYDYPDEKIERIEIYQKPPKSCRTMTEEVTVVVDGVWRVGDLVDWLSRDCFWSATVAEVTDKDKVKIKFPDPPVGEGSIDCVNSKDLRPSLDWSFEFGWTVPTLLGSQNGQLSARLINPPEQGMVCSRVVFSWC